MLPLVQRGGLSCWWESLPDHLRRTTQQKARPEIRIVEVVGPQRLALCVGEGGCLIAARVQATVEPRHHACGRTVIHGPQRREDTPSTGVMECLDQTYPIVPRRHVRERPGSHSGLTGAQHYQAGV